MKTRVRAVLFPTFALSLHVPFRNKFMRSGRRALKKRVGASFFIRRAAESRSVGTLFALLRWEQRFLEESPSHVYPIIRT